MPPSIKISSRYWETQIQTIGESRLASIDPQNENSLCFRMALIIGCTSKHIKMLLSNTKIFNAGQTLIKNS